MEGDAGHVAGWGVFSANTFREMNIVDDVHRLRVWIGRSEGMVYQRASVYEMALAMGSSPSGIALAYNMGDRHN